MTSVYGGKTRAVPSGDHHLPPSQKFTDHPPSKKSTHHVVIVGDATVSNTTANVSFCILIFLMAGKQGA